jgi:hypothetical protein
MKPGIYSRAQVANYDAIDAVNYSSLKMLAKSPKHYQHYKLCGSKETRPMFKGTAAHIAILEPERFATEYAIFTGRRKAGKEWEAFETAALEQGKTVLKKAELDEAIAMRDAVREDPLASSYLSGGQHEVTLVWEDGETGLPCKGRLDFLRGGTVAVDVKTTRDASPHWFARDVARLQYHVQAAMYFDALATLTNRDPRFVVVAIESSAPYDVVTYDLPEPVIEAGRDEYQRLMRLLVECRRDNHWPGIGNGFEQTLTLPTWSLPDSSDDLELTIGGESFTV